jgi:hypothetical protein
LPTGGVSLQEPVPEPIVERVVDAVIVEPSVEHSNQNTTHPARELVPEDILNFLTSEPDLPTLDGSLEYYVPTLESIVDSAPVEDSCATRDSQSQQEVIVEEQIVNAPIETEIEQPVEMISKITELLSDEPIWYPAESETDVGSEAALPAEALVQPSLQSEVSLYTHDEHAHFSALPTSMPIEELEYDSVDSDSVAGPDELQDQSLKSLTQESKTAFWDSTTQFVLNPPRHTKASRRELAYAEQDVLSRQTAEDLVEDKHDINMVSNITEEIFEYYRELENTMLPNKHYMDIQTEIQWSMRSVLIDWVIQVHDRLILLPETLFLTINCIDRFLSAKVISVGKLQLVGAVALLIAAKYEEISAPQIKEIVFMVDNGFTKEEIIKAERFMLTMLNWELGWPGPMSFLRRISKADDYDFDTRTLAKYLLEATIMDEAFIGLVPSYVAAGCHCLARTLLRKGNWTLSHVHYSGYTYTQLHPLVLYLVHILEFPMEHHPSVFEKYQQRRFKKASLYVQDEMRRGVVVPEPQKFAVPGAQLASTASTAPTYGAAENGAEFVKSMAMAGAPVIPAFDFAAPANSPEYQQSQLQQLHNQHQQVQY